MQILPACSSTLTLSAETVSVVAQQELAKKKKGAANSLNAPVGLGGAALAGVGLLAAVL